MKNKNNKIRNILLFILFLSLIQISKAENPYSSQLPNYEEGKVNVYFFYSPTCPHCRAEEPFLSEMEEKYSELNIHRYEASKNQDLLKQVAELYSTSTSGVPRTFIGNKSFIGYTEDKGKLEYNTIYHAYIGYKNILEQAMINEMSNTTSSQISNNTEISNTSEIFYTSNIINKNKFPFWIFSFLLLYLLTLPLFYKKINNNANIRRYWIAGLFLIIIILIFVFISLTPENTIKEFANKLPFPLFVFVIALADGFNPCSFSVLIILLSLLTYTKKRKDMFIFGSTFVLVSGIMYFIFIMTMVFAGSWALDKYGTLILKILGVIITIAGAINLKDYLFFKKGISLSLSKKEQMKFTTHARKIINRLKEAENFHAYFFALGGTVILAVLVSLVELGCTAILPVVYMATLIGRYGETIGVTHVLWTAFYILIYIIPISAILMNFIYTFKTSRLSEEQGRILKLVAGLFMLVFGLLMLIKPTILLG